ncbi:MAG: DMT family transporter [Candidatus Brocadiia bacterium]
MSHRGDERALAVLCLAGATCCYGAVPIFIRHFTTYLDVWCVNAVRYSVGALFWLPCVLVLGRRVKRTGAVSPGRSVWRDAWVPAAVNLTGQVGYGLSPYFVTAPTIGFMIRLSFLFAILWGFLFLPQERGLARSALFLVGAVLCVGGAVLMFAERLGAGGDRSVAGLAILVGTAMCWAGYAVGVRVRMPGYPVRLSFGVISLYTAGGLVVLMVLFGDTSALARLGGRLWALLVLSGFIGVASAHVLYYRGIHALGPVVASGALMATPFVTLFGSALALGEMLSWLQLLGGVAVVAGGALLVVAKGRLERARVAADTVATAARMR